MKVFKRIFSIALLVGLLVSPCTSAHKNKNQTFLSKHKTKLIVTAVATGGAATLGALAWYQIRKKRVPSIADIHSFGSESGQPVISSHGFGHFWGEVVPYTKQNSLSGRYIFDTDTHDITVFNYADANIGFDERITLKWALKFKFDQVCLGQERDIARIKKAAANFDKPNSIGFGVSRGAATFINFMGTDPSPNIRAIILDSPFASIEETIEHRMSKRYSLFLGKISIIPHTIHKLLPVIFPLYDSNGIQPIDAIDKIDPTIPIILLHSQKDGNVPVSASRQLYIKRKQQGCNNVYLVELSSGTHAKSLHGPDGERFQNAVHAFYKKYRYPHNPDFANQINLDDYQPSIEEVERRPNS